LFDVAYFLGHLEKVRSATAAITRMSLTTLNKIYNLRPYFHVMRERYDTGTRDRQQRAGVKPRPPQGSASSLASVRAAATGAGKLEIDDAPFVKQNRWERALPVSFIKLVMAAGVVLGCLFVGKILLELSPHDDCAEFGDDACRQGWRY
jgi:hypothetical protein